MVLDTTLIEEESKKAGNFDAKYPINVSKLTKIFKKKGKRFAAINEVSFILEKNQTIGLLGPNGAGKSTLFNLLSTYYRANGGEIRVEGIPISKSENFFFNTGLCPQDDILWSTFTVEDHLNIFRKLYNVP